MEVFDKRYAALEDEFSSNGFEIIQAKKGPWSHEDVEGFAYELETVLGDKEVKKGIVKRIFSLIIEALQNIRLHGYKDETGEQVCFFFIAKNEEKFTVMTANLIHKDVINKVQTKIDKINTLDRAGLKEYYMETLTDGQRSSKGGAGLGFITVAMKAKNKLDYTFDEVNGECSKFEMFCDLLLTKEED